MKEYKVGQKIKIRYPNYRREMCVVVKVFKNTLLVENPRGFRLTVGKLASFNSLRETR
jgi:hypothetical protein